MDFDNYNKIFRGGKMTKEEKGELESIIDNEGFDYECINPQKSQYLIKGVK